jgi:hypothetical protein
VRGSLLRLLTDGLERFRADWNPGGFRIGHDL